jgi:hypothetical protein
MDDPEAFSRWANDGSSRRQAAASTAIRCL